MSPQKELKEEAVAKKLKRKRKLRGRIFKTESGAPDAKKHGAASLSPKKKKPVEIDIKSSLRVNDNAGLVETPEFHYLKRAACIAAVSVVGAVALGQLYSPLSMQNIAAHIAMNSPDWVLNYTMENNPDSLAYALNAISPGE